MTLTERTRPIVDGLLAARLSGRRWRVENFDESLSLEEGYAIQAGVADRLDWFPQGPKAWKVGGKPVITAAPLPEVLSSPATWTPAAAGAVVVEAELAFRLNAAPNRPEDVLRCVDSVCVSIEMVDTRMEGGLDAPAAWKLADQGVHAGLVVGPEQPHAVCAGFTLNDWARQTCRLLVNGAVVKQTQGTHPTGDPLSALPWLAAHAAQHTGGLRAGDLITTGAWIIHTVQPGDAVRVEFDGFGAADLQIRG